MEHVLISPAKASVIGIPTVVFSVLIPLIGLAVFAYIMNKRIAPLLKAAPDNRFNRYPERIKQTLKIWLAQYRQPRYLLGGILHIIIFAGFVILSLRSFILKTLPLFIYPR